MTAHGRIAALAAAWISLSAFAQQKLPGRYEVSGIVVDHRTRAPLEAVMVALTPVATARGESLSVVTAADGRFHFTGLTQGKYALSAERRGEQAQQLRAHGQFSTAIATGPDVDSQDVVFPLFAESRLSGTVIDDDNDPVQSAQVFLLSKQMVDGESRILMRSQSTTSASGAFHFGHLRAGLYYLAVTARPWYAGTSEYISHPDSNGVVTNELVLPPALLDRAYPITYSGNATEPSAAQPIALMEGGSVSTEIDLHAVPSVHFSVPDRQSVELAGTASPRFRINRGVGMSAVTLGGVEIPIPSVLMSRPGDDTTGEDEISGVSPGTYRMNHVTNPVVDGVVNSSEDLVNIDTNGSVILSKVLSTMLTGQVTYSGLAPQGNVGLQLLGERTGSSVMVKPDGSFAFPHAIAPGHYHLRLAGETGLSVQAVGGVKHVVEGDTLVIPVKAPKSLDIEVIAAPSSDSLFSGTAVRDGKPVAGAMVLLVPETISEASIIGRDQSDSDGTFVIPDVRPGRYTLLAFDCDQDDESCGIEYRNPAVMKPYLAQGKPITLSKPGKEKFDATVVHSVSQP